MKFKGQTVSNTNVEYVVIPRGDYEIVFIAKPVLSLDEFHAVCKEPVPPTITYPESTGKAPEKDFEDPDYDKQLKEYYLNRYYWMILTSLKDSPDIEWETVDLLNPATYKNYSEELKQAQFLPAEINKINEAVSLVNALDERQMDEARKNFLALKQAQEV